MIKSVCEIFILEVYASVTSHLLILLEVHVSRIVRQKVPSISQVGFKQLRKGNFRFESSETLCFVTGYIHRVRKRLSPPPLFFRCPVCGEWCKLHWLLL